jgi:hypothetical protein
MRASLLFLAGSLAVSSTLVAAAAHAGEEGAAEPYLQTIEVHAEPRVHTALLDGGRIVRSCIGDCTLQVRPGVYRLRAQGDFPTRTVRLRAGLDARVEVEPGDSTSRWGGLALGIVGSGTLFIGLIALMFSSTSCMESCNGDEKRLPLIVTGLGAAMTTVGWIAFGMGGTSVDVSPRDGAPRAGPGFAFGVVPTRGGAMGAVGWTF